MSPHPGFSAIAIATTIAIAIAFHLPSQDPGSSEKPYVRTGGEATLSGTVTFAGKPPSERIIDMSADPTCYQFNPEPTTEWYVVSNQQLANVIVYVTNNVLDNYSFEIPSSPVLLDHKGCRYEPHVLGMRVGQVLRITNSDETVHNTHPTPKYNLEWNQSQPIGAPAIEKTFKHPEVAVPIKDNQHPWEKAYVGVFSHPFFAVTDASGNFLIEGLPPGTYKVIAWHESLG